MSIEDNEELVTWQHLHPQFLRVQLDNGEMKMASPSQLKGSSK